MPGGIYRDKISLEGQDISPERQAAIKDVDLYLETNPFDLETYQKIKSFVSDLYRTSNGLCELEEYKTAESLNAAIARLDELKTEMEMPIYDHLISLDHQRKTLVG